jgi:hypothetical protein
MAVSAWGCYAGVFDLLIPRFALRFRCMILAFTFEDLELGV